VRDTECFTIFCVPTTGVYEALDKSFYARLT
jgi:hypothetical protein